MRANGTLTHYSYDGVNCTTELSTTLSSTLLTQFQYSLNRAGLATSASETLGSATRVIAYGYDGLHRLGSAAETPGKTYTYTYDLVGNRTQVQVDGVTTEWAYPDLGDTRLDSKWRCLYVSGLT
jgi:YD repeat-containing protein